MKKLALVGLAAFFLLAVGNLVACSNFPHQHESTHGHQTGAAAWWCDSCQCGVIQGVGTVRCKGCVDAANGNGWCDKHGAVAPGAGR